MKKILIITLSFLFLPCFGMDKRQKLSPEAFEQIRQYSIKELDKRKAAKELAKREESNKSNLTQNEAKQNESQLIEKKDKNKQINLISMMVETNHMASPLVVLPSENVTLNGANFRPIWFGFAKREGKPTDINIFAARFEIEKDETVADIKKWTSHAKRNASNALHYVDEFRLKIQNHFAFKLSDDIFKVFTDEKLPTRILQGKEGYYLQTSFQNDEGKIVRRNEAWKIKNVVLFGQKILPVKRIPKKTKK